MKLLIVQLLAAQVGNEQRSLFYVSYDFHFSSLIAKNGSLIAITDKGYGKRLLLEDLKSHARNSKGIRAIKFKAAGKVGGQDALRSVKYCDDEDEMMITTSKGTITRQKVKAIGSQSRKGPGGKIMTVNEDDFITNIDVFKPEETDK
jgi:DNA gyrase subunit A